MIHSLGFQLALLLMLCGCGGDVRKAPPEAERDPAVTGALGDPIMVDPDLTAQSEAGAAVSGMGGSAVEIPPADRSPEALAAARAEAARLAGGRIGSAPSPEEDGSEVPARPPITAAVAARALDPRCADRVDYSAIWAARLPPALPVYPRGAVQEAAGTDEAGCRLRAVNFQTQVPAGEVIDFYAAMSRKAGFALKNRLSGEDHVLSGRRQGAAFRVSVRSLDGGLSEVDLVVNGG